MHAFITFLAIIFGFAFSVVATFAVMLWLSSRDPDISAGGAYFIAAVMLSVITGPLGAFTLGYYVYRNP